MKWKGNMKVERRRNRIYYLSGFGETSEEMKWQRLSEHKAERLENVDLHLLDLALVVRVVGHVDKVVDGRHVHFLVLCGEKESRDAHELQIRFGDLLRFQECVDDLYAQIERLLQQMKLGVHLNEPVDKYGAHLDRHDLVVHKFAGHAETSLKSTTNYTVNLQYKPEGDHHSGLTH